MKLCVRFTYEGNEYVTTSASPNVIEFFPLLGDVNKQDEIKTTYGLELSDIPTVNDAVVKAEGDGYYVSGTFKFKGGTFKIDTATMQDECEQIDGAPVEPLVTAPVMEEEPQSDEAITDTAEVTETVEESTDVTEDTPNTDSGVNESNNNNSNIENSEAPDMHVLSDSTVTKTNKIEEPSEGKIVEFYKPADPERDKHIAKAPDIVYENPIGFSFGNQGHKAKVHYNTFNFGVFDNVGISFDKPQEPSKLKIGPAVNTVATEEKATVDRKDVSKQVDLSVEKPLGSDNTNPVHVVIDPPYKVEEESEYVEPSEEDEVTEEVVTEEEDTGVSFDHTVITQPSGEISDRPNAFVSEMDEEQRELLERIPIELFGQIQEYASDPIDLEVLKRDGRDFCINNGWHMLGNWFVIDYIRDATRYIFNEEEQISTSIDYNTRLMWKKYKEA